MVQTFSKGAKIYSVDMIFSYIKIFRKKLKVQKVKVTDLEDHLSEPSWDTDDNRSKYFSPMDVINNKNKYKKHMKRIKEANLKYPIIIVDGIIIDGVHRLANAYLNKKKTIKAYVFDKKILKKFLINKEGDFKKVDKMEVYNFINIFYKRFVK